MQLHVAITVSRCRVSESVPLVSLGIVLTKNDFRARLRFLNRARQTTSEFGKLAVFENRDVQFGRCRFRNRSYQRALRPLFININSQT